MSDPIPALQKFTPTGIDRDAVLFAAGRASAPSGRGWKWVSAGLAITQVATFTVWFATTRPVPPGEPPAVPAPFNIDPANPPTELDPNSVLVLARHFDPDAPLAHSPAVAGPPRRPLSVHDHDFTP